jgi:hypothetical protein
LRTMKSVRRSRAYVSPNSATRRSAPHPCPLPRLRGRGSRALAKSRDGRNANPSRSGS